MQQTWWRKTLHRSTLDDLHKNNLHLPRIFAQRIQQFTSVFRFELSLNISIAIGGNDHWQPGGSDGRTRGSVCGSSAGCVVPWAGCVHLITTAAVSGFQNAFNSGMVKNVTNLRSGHKGHRCALAQCDLESTPHDAHFRIHFSWWSAAFEVGVSIPPTIYQ